MKAPSLTRSSTTTRGGRLSQIAKKIIECMWLDQDGNGFSGPSCIDVKLLDQFDVVSPHGFAHVSVKELDEQVKHQRI